MSFDEKPANHVVNPVLSRNFRNSQAVITKLNNQPAGGFFREDEILSKSNIISKHTFEKDEEDSESNEEDFYHLKPKRKKKVLKKESSTKDSTRPIELFIPTFERDQPLMICNECDKKFHHSYLMEKFNCETCDDCHKPRDTHCLITKTTAKLRYLLSDADLDLREPILKYLTKRNPHNDSWGDMRLYLEAQVVDRALEIWGSEKGLEDERERRMVKKEGTKMKQFKKRMKELRLQTRSSCFVKRTEFHVHDFGDEAYDEKRNVYLKACRTCEFVSEYEKL